MEEKKIIRDGKSLGTLFIGHSNTLIDDLRASWRRRPPRSLKEGLKKAIKIDEIIQWRRQLRVKKDEKGTWTRNDV